MMRPSRRAVHSGSDGSSSCIHALAATSVMPVAAPSTSRPTSRSPTESAPANMTVDATPDSSSPPIIKRLRPSTSDAGPA